MKNNGLFIKRKEFLFFFIWMISLTMFAQELTVRGSVKDTKGEPLIGVTVRLKGTTIGMITDINGNFVLSNVPADATLEISYVGMKSQSIPINGRTSIDVVLEEETAELEEVVVVGYGTQKKINLTGAVSSVNSETLENRPVVNAAQALQGLAPGLNITQTGTLGGSLENRPTINIRGVGTIGQGSSGTPLILIDGAEGDINSLNPQDIESVSVLKDAAASSIYGSRAPFGVVLITTKQGKEGKPIINVNSNLRIGGPILVPEMMDSYTFALYFNDAGINAGQTPFFTAERLQRIKDFMDGKIATTIIPNPTNPHYWADGYMEGNDNVDYYKALFSSQVLSQEYSVNASGGRENFSYYLSGNYLDQPGLMKFGSDGYTRYNTTLKVSSKILNWLSLVYTNRFSREDYKRPSYMNDSFYSDLVRQGWPMLPLYDNNGHLYDCPSPPLKLRDGGKAKKQTDALVQQINLTIEPIKDWKILGDLTYRKVDEFYHWDLQKTYNYDVLNNPIPARTQSLVHEDANRSNYFNSNIYTEFSKTLKKHYFKILIGMQAESMEYRNVLAERQGIIAPQKPVLDVTSGNDYFGKVGPPMVSGRYSDWSTLGYFGRINYNFSERYLFEANLRYDGSSRFRSDKRWVYSPSISGGWNISRENFWDPIQKYINILKIRGSYGVLSNQNTQDWYPTYVIMPLGISNGDWLVNGSRPNTASAAGLISSTLTWESVNTWDLGFDISFLNNRLSGTFDYFKRSTDDMVGPAPELPVILGTAVPRTNNTNLETYGFDLSITWKESLKNGLSYNIGFLLSDAQTKITKYPNPTRSLDQYRKGQLMGEIWGYETIGIAKTQEEMDAHLNSLPNGGQNALGANWKAGDIMYNDLNNDGKINDGARTADDHGDLKMIGNSTPRYPFGLDIGANFKGFDFRAFFQGILKRNYFSSTEAFWGIRNGIWWSTGLEPHIDYYRDDPDHPLGKNLNSYYPRPIMGDNKNQYVQTKYLQDASYLRLKNLQVGYTLPSTLSSKIGITKIRAYFSGENICAFTNVAKMFDPETIDGGLAGNVYPLFKTYSVGINITL
jgi:TonB-linked SusC/RagA family outer membrane protein